MAYNNAALRNALLSTATKLGIRPVDLGAVISYETAGTFDPWKAGPTTKWGQHRGLIQWGKPQRDRYGVYEGMPVEGQMDAVARYLADAGVKPGMGLPDIYSAVNAGRVGRYNASDAAAGGAWGTVMDKVRYQMGPHLDKAKAFLGGGDFMAYASPPATTTDPASESTDMAINPFTSAGALPRPFLMQNAPKSDALAQALIAGALQAQNRTPFEAIGNLASLWAGNRLSDRYLTGQEDAKKAAEAEQTKKYEALAAALAGGADPVQTLIRSGDPALVKMGVERAVNPPAAPETPKMFPGTSPEAAGLNYLVENGSLTPKQAAELAAGKTITSPTGEILFMTPTGIFSAPPGGTEGKPTFLFGGPDGGFPAGGVPGPAAVPGAPPATTLTAPPPGVLPASPAAPPAAPPAMPTLPAPPPAAPPAMPPGGPAGPAGPGYREGMIPLTPPKTTGTEGQMAAGLYADRMAKSNEIITKLEEAGTSLGDSLKSRVPLAGNYMVTPEYRQLLQAQRDFVNAVLRRESGAVISDQEFENARQQYFPQPGDDPATIEQKRANRATAIAGIARAAGPNYKPPAITAPAPAAPAGGPAPGAIEDGYRFKGGNPSDPANWEPVR